MNIYDPVSCCQVQPFAGIIDTVRYDVPRVLFNRDAVGPFRYSRRIHDVVAPGTGQALIDPSQPIPMAALQVIFLLYFFDPTYFFSEILFNPAF